MPIRVEITHKVQVSLDKKSMNLLERIASQNILIIQKLNNMPTKEEFQAAFDDVNSATTQIGENITKVGERIGKLEATIGGLGLDSETESTILNQLKGVAPTLKQAGDALQQMAQDTENPVPVEPPVEPTPVEPTPEPTPAEPTEDPIDPNNQ
jgi:hypothetical protein